MFYNKVCSSILFVFLVHQYATGALKCWSQMQYDSFIFFYPKIRLANINMTDCI